MSERGNPIRMKRHIALIALAWLIMIGFDFLIHAGILAPLYREPHPFLLPMEDALKLIPLGYASFLLLAVLLGWLMERQRVESARSGFLFAVKIGILAWGAFCLGLLSISSAPAGLLLGWFAGQAIEMGLGGLIIGAGRGRERIGALTGLVVLTVLLMLVLGIVLQNITGGGMPS